MADPGGARTSDARMDATSLYREEIYTDRAAGTLRVMLPVKPDGSPDGSRQTLFIGEAQILTNMGPLPISFEVEAKNLAEAVAGYGEAAGSASSAPYTSCRSCAVKCPRRSSFPVLPAQAACPAVFRPAGWVARSSCLERGSLALL